MRFSTRPFLVYYWLGLVVSLLVLHSTLLCLDNLYALVPLARFLFDGGFCLFCGVLLLARSQQQDPSPRVSPPFNVFLMTIYLAPVISLVAGKQSQTCVINSGNSEANEHYLHCLDGRTPCVAFCVTSI